MKKDKLKDKFLESLERTPIIQVACEQVGISRNTYYRWRKEDVDFSLLAEDRINVGINRVNDYAESNVLNGIKKGDPGYTKYWLNSRHKMYRRPFYYKPGDDPLKEERERQEIEKAERETAEWERQWIEEDKEKKKKST
jgi:hypothetical protein